MFFFPPRFISVIIVIYCQNRLLKRLNQYNIALICYYYKLCVGTIIYIAVPIVGKTPRETAIRYRKVGT